MEERAFWKNRFLSLCLALIFAVPLLAPLASADGMETCDSVSGFSDCDDYDSDDDETPSRQDWIRGTYEFDLQDTSTIHMSLSWAIREFDRSKIGLDDSTTQTALAFDGLDEDDGIPADMIRPVSPTMMVLEQLVTRCWSRLKTPSMTSFPVVLVRLQPSTRSTMVSTQKQVLPRYAQPMQHKIPCMILVQA